MIEMKFKDWLLDREKAEVENTTSTSCIANFARPIIPGMIRRMRLPYWGEEDPWFKRHRHGRNSASKD